MIQLRGKIGRRRHQIKRRWRKKRGNTIAAPSSIFRYLNLFINGVEEKKREMGKSFIPSRNHHLRGLGEVNYELLDFMQKHDCQSTATLDIDATFSVTHKEDALFSYKGDFEGALEPFNRTSTGSQHKFDKEVEGLKSKLNHKYGIIMELLEENLRLKKTMGIIDRQLD